MPASPEIIRDAIRRCATADPGSPLDRGALIAVQRNADLPTTITGAAGRLLAAIPVRDTNPLPAFVDPLASVIRHAEASRRELKPAELQLLQLLGDRRDSLTDDELVQAAQLGAAAEDSDRTLAEYVLAPGRARIKSASLEHQRQVGAHALATLPAALPSVPDGDRRELLAELGRVVMAEVPGLTPEEGTTRAAAEWDQARADGTGALIAARQAAEQLIATAASTPVVPSITQPVAEPAVPLGGGDPSQLIARVALIGVGCPPSYLAMMERLLWKAGDTLTEAEAATRAAALAADPGFASVFSPSAPPSASAPPSGYVPGGRPPSNGYAAGVLTPFERGQQLAQERHGSPDQPQPAG
jgi:hypothetical protein